MPLNRNQTDTTGYSDIDYTNTTSYQDSSVHKDFWEVTKTDVDSANGLTEYSFIPQWTKWYGYYHEIATFSATIDKLANWSVGKGYKLKKGLIKSLKSRFKLSKIKGNGKDDFNSILENLIKVALLAGDSFAEIIKDKAGRLINVKVLNSGSIRIVQDEYGMIKRYEIISKSKKYNSIKKDVIQTVKPDKMLHLSWNRIADEIHGTPLAEKVEWVLKAKQEAFLQTKILMKRHVQPVQIISVGTDDETEAQDIKTKINNAYKNTENIIAPSGLIEKIETVSTPQYSTIDPLPWIKYLQREYVTSCGVPEVILGWGEETTEASSKVIYLAFEQTISRIQRYLEDQLRLQIGVEIDLEFPASLEQDLQKDNKKDGQMKSGKPSDLNPAKTTK